MKQALKFIGFIFDSIKIILGVSLIAFIAILCLAFYRSAQTLT
jgi:hypothetical protein